ncbi:MULTISPECIES: phosphate acyltransferase PlsX [unclassified Iodidimonas]|uniref:phosphate acyltransferase PlsX n=1 Tax=unclassified Iodidimonas TaxID=2626145 RepID=UPI0024830133|nr:MULTISPECIES: phosphate acyltransferase PlsX [unclassified Iodidimonas]
MKKHLTIALDAMGGDQAPAVVVHGAHLARERYPDVHFVFFGRSDDVLPLLDAAPLLKKVSRFVHTDDVVQAEDKPGKALRRSRQSSMALAIESVKAGECDVAVSAGNTGALMALAKFILRTLPSIDRPALASLLPTYKGECVMLDLGANVECDASNLVEFSVMGAAFARTVLGLQRPRVGLLNIGVEELKGNEEVKEAAEILRTSDLPMEFCGFIEGNMIGAGETDVVVTDGFTGNVALKAVEGTAQLIGRLVGDAFRSSWRARLGYLLARRGMNGLRDHLDPNNHNGAVMLGLNGLVVKSHGGATVEGYATAIGVAIDMAHHNLIHLITKDLGGVAMERQDNESLTMDTDKQAESKSA